MVARVWADFGGFLQVGWWLGGIVTLLLALAAVLLVRRSRRMAAPALLGRPGSTPTAVDAKPAATERRRSPRRWGLPIEVLITDAHARAEPVKGWIINRSTGGICLSVVDEGPVGAILSVRPTHAPPDTPWTQVEVRNCHFHIQRWQLGCQFCTQVPLEVMVLFG